MSKHQNELHAIFGDLERKALAQPDTPITIYKSTIAHCQQRLTEAFESGAPIDDLVHARASIMDQILQIIWSHKVSNTQDIALIAVGGYGRLELHPHSDIDLLILIKSAPEQFSESIEQFIMLLWDIGLDIGHSVRTLEECIKESEQDVTVTTNLIESRLLVGEQTLFQQLSDANQNTWDTHGFYQAKLEEQIKRDQKFDDTAYNLEPNLKDGPGGLRDIQTVGWIAKHHFNVTSSKALVEKAFLTEEEFGLFTESKFFLWQVRFALHTITNRHEDRLLFDHQTRVAELLGFITPSGEPDIEQLMKVYYRTVLKISRLNELLLQLFREATLTPEDNDIPITPLSADFQIHHQYIEVTSDQVFLHNPSALLDIFLQFQRRPEILGVRASTIRLIRQYRYLIDDDFRNNEKNKRLFLSIFQEQTGLTRTLHRMNKYGILASYLPAFSKIVGQMQYDLFHHYTVDEHTMFVVRNCRRMETGIFSHELPYQSELIKTLPKPELLYLAAFFHDIGKGRGGDHSVLGAVDAEAFCTSHGLNRQDTHLVVWLVKSHLKMSVTAQRKDISDPDVVHEFASEVSNTERLKYLYLLTTADIRGTNPTLWNQWKDSLLKSLYRSTRDMINSGLDLPVEQADFVNNAKELARTKLHNQGLSDTTIDSVWQNFEDEYFLRCNENEIAWHTQQMTNYSGTEPLVLVHNHDCHGCTEVFIYTPDSTCIFAVATAVIAKHYFSIVDAWVVTTLNGYTVDSFQILTEEGERITEQSQMDALAEQLVLALKDAKSYPLGINRRLPRQLKHFDKEDQTRVAFFQDKKQNRTVIDINTTDKPSLLSLIGIVFSDSEIYLHHAKIATIGANAEDWFYVSDSNGLPITDPDLLKKLRTDLIQALDD